MVAIEPSPSAAIQERHDNKCIRALKRNADKSHHDRTLTIRKWEDSICMN
jgi:hypothetical protein